MACPSRESISVVVVGLILVGVIVCIPVVLIGGLIIVHGVSVTVEDVSLAVSGTATTPTTMANSTPPPTTMTAAAVTITYKISMTVRVHNPNWFLGIYFAAPLEARYSLDGALFGPRVLLAGEKLHSGITLVYNLTTGAVGETVPLGAERVADFARQISVGVFELDMVVAGNYTVRGSKRSLAATCVLKPPHGPLASSKKMKCV